MKNIEYKNLSLKIDDIKEEGTIKGYASTFNEVDLGMDTIATGAFRKTLKENRGIFPILADHNPSKQIGWNIKATEDEKGLYVEGNLDLNIPDAAAKFSLAKKALELGAKLGLSIGYSIIKAEPQKEAPLVRVIKELKLYEYSLVTFPMNTSAMVTGVKALEIDTIKGYIQKLSKEGMSLNQIIKSLGLADEKKEEEPELFHSLDALIKTLKN